MPHPDGSPAYAIVGISARRPQMAEVVQDDGQEAMVRGAGLHDQGQDDRELVGLTPRLIGRDDANFGLELLGEELDAECENLALILEIQIEDGARDAATLRDFLEGSVLVTFVDEYVEGLPQNLPFA